MKTQLVLFLLLCLGFFANAQTSGAASISGNVIDHENKAVEFATVVLYQSKDSAMVKGAVTNEKGDFQMENLAAGNYFLVSSFVGLANQPTQPFALGNEQHLVMDAIRMHPGDTNLKEMTVVAKKPLIEVKADKTVFNVESSINATGATAMELLQKAPGVVVDKDDNISMKGKNGVRIYIDGKPSQLDHKELAALLRSMQSSDLESIEMISNPSAKYDASGNAGIINFKLKRNKNIGFNGNLNAGVSYGRSAKYNGSVGLNYRNQKLNAYGNYSIGDGKNENHLNLYRVQNGMVFDQKSTQFDDFTNHGFKAGLDYFINSKNTIGAIVNGNLTNGAWTSFERTPISDEASGNVSKILVATNEVPMSRNNLNYNLNYRYADTLGREWTFDADYGMFQNRAKSYQPNYYYDASESNILSEAIYRNNTPTHIDIYTLKTDYEQNALGGKLGFGLKYANVQTRNTFEFFDVVNGEPVLNSDRSNRFKYTENVNAAYVNYNRSLGKQFSLQAGVRVEQTKSIGDLQSDTPKPGDYVERNYTDLFPSAALTYQMNPMNSFTLTYSRRIDRPVYQDLNPFENKIDELTYQKGNAFLRPQYTDNFELTHNYHYLLNTSISYSHSSDYFAQITDTIEGTRSFITNRNLADQHLYSLNIGSPLPIASWWNGYANFNIYHSRYLADLGEGRKIKLNITSYNVYMQHTFSAPGGWSFELSGFYNAPSVWAGTFKSKEMWGMDGGIQKTVLKGQGTLKLTLTDIFHTMNWAGISNVPGAYFNASGSWESQQVRLNFSYRFGNSQVKAAREHKTGMEEENKRIKQGN